MSAVYVYAIAKGSGDGTHGPPIKIGVASDPWARLASLQTASPFPLSFVNVVLAPSRACAERIERAVHAKHADQRTHGEWFDIGTLDAEFSLCTGVIAEWKSGGMTRAEFEASRTPELMERCIYWGRAPSEWRPSCH